MGNLSQEQCTACRADAPLLSSEQVAGLMPEVDAWALIEEEGQQRLDRVFDLPDFETAMRLSNEIGAFAEQVGHHPRLIVEWGRLRVTWWTHKIGGLHRNDFICAARSSDLAAQL